MERLKQLEPLIERVLEEEPLARQDNFALYLGVLSHQIDIGTPIGFVFRYHKVLGIPSLESITRIRRKIQERRPDLKDAETQEMRENAVKDFYDYAKNS